MDKKTLMERGYEYACDASEVGQPMPKLVTLGGRGVLICREGDELFAVDEICPHENQSMRYGVVFGGITQPPLCVCADLPAGASRWRSLGASMKRLIVMRHAKSGWETGPGGDHARPLNERGRRDAPRMGAALRDRGWIPQQVLSSDSQRTRETFGGLASGLGTEVDVTFTSDLYHAGPSEVVAACEELDEATETALVLGHNPGWENVVSYLSGELIMMSTADCALLEADGSWMELMTEGAWKLVDVLRPKEA